MHGEPYAVAEAVDVALLGALAGAHSCVAARLEQVAHRLLRRAAGQPDLQGLHAGAEGVVHVRVQFLERLGGAAQAEGAGEVAVVAAARLAREDVNEQRCPGAQGFQVVAAVVRHAGVAALRDDGLAAFEPVLEEDLVEEPAQVADPHRAAAVRAERVAVAAQVLQEAAQPLDRGHGPTRSLADDLDLGVALRHARQRQDVGMAVFDKQRRVHIARPLEQRVREADRRLAEPRDRPAQAEGRADLSDEPA